MKRVASALAMAACLALTARQAPVARAQLDGGGVAVGFRNELKTPVVVQGYTIINGMPKAGQALIILPGKIAAENNVPMGAVRFYTICDANRPAIVHLRNFPVPVGTNDLSLAIRGLGFKVFLQPLP